MAMRLLFLFLLLLVFSNVLCYDEDSNGKTNVLREENKEILKETVNDMNDVNVNINEQIITRHEVTKEKTEKTENQEEDRVIEESNILYQSAIQLLESNTNNKMAIEKLEAAAQMGHKEALNKLADEYFFGLNTDEDFSKAFDYYSQLSRMGNSKANSMLGLMFSYGLGVKADPAKSLLYHKMGSLGGESLSKLALGYKYHFGIGTPKNCEEAAAQYLPIATNAVKNFQRIGGHPSDKIRLIDEEDTPGVQNIDHILNYHSYIADSGDLQSQLLLGQVFLHGSHGVPQNLKLAHTFLLAASEQKDPAASGLLGLMYLEGAGVQKNPEEALELFKIGQAKDESNSLNGLGLMHLHGIVVEKDPHKALTFFQKASDLDNPDASVNLALMHYNGLATPADKAKALNLFTTASRKGHLLGQYYLGLMQLYGHGSRKSCSIATAFLKLVAERSEAAEIIEKAYRHFRQGEYNIASKFYLIAAEQGFEVAQANYAYLIDEDYIQGDTEENRSRRALVQYLRSSFQGQIDSTVKSGDYYYYGKGVTKDLSKSASIYTLAEQSGSAQAMFNLGYMHQYGIGVDEDLFLAKRYYDKAMAGKDKDAHVPTYLALLTLYAKMIMKGQTQELFIDDYQWLEQSLNSVKENFDWEIVTDLANLFLILIVAVVFIIRLMLR